MGSGGGENEAPADATLLQPSVRQRHVLKRVGLRDAKGQLPLLGQGDLAKVVGAKPPLRLPAWLGRLLAGEFVVAQMTSWRGASNEKARKELGWEPQYASWREGFRAWVGG